MEEIEFMRVGAIGLTQLVKSIGFQQKKLTCASINIEYVYIAKTVCLFPIGLIQLV